MISGGYSPVRYFFHVGYQGFAYRGWQRLPQTKGANLQEIFETHLGRILKHPVAIVGCGRTDAQVHAAQFFFHVDIDRSWDFDLLFRLNKNLPDDVAAHEIIEVEPKAHARFDAFSRTYQYLIHTTKDPYLDKLSTCYLGERWNVSKMAQAAKLLTKYDDYRSFSKNTPVDHSTTCRVSESKLFVDEESQAIRFEITSNRFLNGMIRIIVNKLVMVGREELTVDDFEELLAAKQRPVVNRLAPPQGLYLTAVRYPRLVHPVHSGFFNRISRTQNWTEV